MIVPASTSTTERCAPICIIGTVLPSAIAFALAIMILRSTGADRSCAARMPASTLEWAFAQYDRIAFFPAKARALASSRCEAESARAALLLSVRVLCLKWRSFALKGDCGEGEREGR